MEKFGHITAVPLVLFSLIVASCLGQGLFPPVDVLYNYAANKPATATSTCGVSQPTSFCLPSQSVAQCVSQAHTCNATCPHGTDAPSYQDVLQGAQLHGGVRFEHFIASSTQGAGLENCYTVAELDGY